MPTINRERQIEAPPQRVWDMLSDPEHLPRWWPGVARVEDASPKAWTMVLTTPKGKAVRADYSLLESEPPQRVVWRHEVEESPFERLMTDSRLQFLVDPEAGGTLVRVSQRIKLRGLSRFGGLQVRRATARTLEEALEGLERVTV